MKEKSEANNPAKRSDSKLIENIELNSMHIGTDSGPVDSRSYGTYTVHCTTEYTGSVLHGTQ